jgi:hypothetical protein
MSRRGSLLLVAAIGAAVLAPAVHAAKVHGVVSSSEDGTRLSAMTVAAYTTAGVEIATFTTNAMGEYSLLSLEAGEYRFLAYDPAGMRATSFHSNASSFETSDVVSLAADANLRIDFKLVRAGWIRGTVRAAEDESLLSGMVVTAYNLDGSRRGSTTTGADGAFSLTLPPGSFRLAAWDDTLEYAVQFHPAGFRFEDAEAIAVASGKETRAELRLPRSAVATGVVRERGSGAGIAGARVTAYLDHRPQVSAVTYAAGHYRLLVPPTGLRLLAWDPAGVYATAFDGDATSFEATPRRLFAAAEEVPGIDFALVRGGRIEGTVRAASNGEPLAGVTVAAFNEDGSRRAMVTTGADGAYSLLVPPGSFRIGAWTDALTHLEQFHPGVERFESAAVVSVASGLRVGGIDILLTGAGRIHGVVRSTAYESIGGVLVALYAPDGSEMRSTIADPDGTFALRAAPGVYRLLAADPEGDWATGYYRLAKNFESATLLQILAGDDLRADLEMAPAGRIAGTVRGLENGLPLLGMHVEAFDLEGARIGTAVTDGDGGFELILPGGSYKLVATDPRVRHARRWYLNASGFGDATVVTVVAGNRLTIEFELEPQQLPRRRAVGRRS